MSVWLFWEDHFDFYESSLVEDDLRAFAAPYIRPGEDISATERLRTEVESLRAELGASGSAGKLEAIVARFAPCRVEPWIEPRLRLRNLSRRHPRIASTFKHFLQSTAS